MMAKRWGLTRQSTRGKVPAGYAHLISIAPNQLTAHIDIHFQLAHFDAAAALVFC